MRRSRIPCPFIKDGLLVLFRGVGNKASFSWRNWDGDLSPDKSAILQRYFDVQHKAFSDSEVSFQVAHAWVCRYETGFLQWKMSWRDLAGETGFDPEKTSLGRHFSVPAILHTPRTDCGVEIRSQLREMHDSLEQRQDYVVL